MSALCVLSDSGTITEEASILNLCAITIRNTHQRPEGMDSGTLIMSGLKKDRVQFAIKSVTEQYQQSCLTSRPISDYENTHASIQIVTVVASYIDYINRLVWSKDL